MESNPQTIVCQLNSSDPFSAPGGNETTFVYDDINRLTDEKLYIDSVEKKRHYEYDGYDLKQKTDRDGRVTVYDYDNLHRLKEENWFDDALDTTSNHTISYTYDANSNLKSAADGGTEYSYDYDYLDRQTTVTQTIDGLTPAVSFVQGYDAASRMISSSASIGSTADYLNSYTYDALDRLRTVTQSDQSGNAVSPKRVDFAYNALGQFSDIDRYASTTNANPVANTVYGYDLANRLTSLEHTGTASGSTFEETFGYGYDKASRVTHFTSAIDGVDATYDYDATGQLTAVDHDDSLDDETYYYDDNGNRTSDDSATYEIGKHNRIASDDTYTYEYDDEGNLLHRTDISNGSNHVDYTWDNRNRLIHVSETINDHEDLTVDYVYDAFNQLIARYSDRPFSGGPSSTVYVYDDGQVVLQFDKADIDELTASDLSHRYLWGPAVDQLLGDENVVDDETLWAMTDRQGSVTDIVDNDGTERIQRVFDSFGNMTAEDHYDAAGDPVTVLDTGYLDEAFAYTGRLFDKDTGLQNNLNRWYDPKLGRWMSEDPIGLGPDANPYRYVGNSSVNGVDPSGLDPVQGGRAYGGPGNPNDEQRLLGMCNGDPKCEQAVRDLVGALPPRPGHFNWPDVRDRYNNGGGCVTWVLRTQSKIIDEKAAGRTVGIKITPIKKYYYGWNPLWREHHWVEGRLSNGSKFYMDDGTCGGEDHIFFDYDHDTFRDTPHPPWYDRELLIQPD